jgi:WhiB family redox-sensing transcriptional regulator
VEHEPGREGRIAERTTVGRSGCEGGGVGTDAAWSFDGSPLTMGEMSEVEVDVDVQGLPDQVSPPDHWQERAACYGLDPEVFFPTTEEEAGLALSYCGVCQVRDTCLAWAVRNGERYGVWGGTTEQQRRRLIRHVA